MCGSGGEIPDVVHESRQLLGDVVRYRMGYIYFEQYSQPEYVRHGLVDADAGV